HDLRQVSSHGQPFRKSLGPIGPPTNYRQGSNTDPGCSEVTAGPRATAGGHGRATTGGEGRNGGRRAAGGCRAGGGGRFRERRRIVPPGLAEPGVRCPVVRAG